MEENLEENVKKDNKKVKILIGLIILIISIVVLFAVNRTNCCNAIWVKHKIFEYNMANEYDETFLRTSTSNVTSSKIISNYEEYQECVEDFKEFISKQEDTKEFEKIEEEFYKEKYNEKFFEKNNIVIVENTRYNQMLKNVKLDEVVKNLERLDVIINCESYGIVGGKSNVLTFMVIKKEKMNGVRDINVIINNNANRNSFFDYEMHDDKPIIYLYPKNNTNISVRLSNPEKLICSYPLYIDGWKVNAEPDGMLTYLENGRKLYSLYYESKNIVDFDIEDDGFVIKGEDSANFLEEKLEILGLNEIEAEEFIIYWLPKLEANKYNYIRFATSEEINNNMELDIQPKPDSVIRVLMVFKGLDEPIKVKEQELVSPNREGFVVVEWGGTEIK